jgi:hypothetical protein
VRCLGSIRTLQAPTPAPRQRDETLALRCTHPPFALSSLLRAPAARRPAPCRWPQPRWVHLQLPCGSAASATPSLQGWSGARQRAARAFHRALGWRAAAVPEAAAGLSRPERGAFPCWPCLPGPFLHDPAHGPRAHQALAPRRHALPRGAHMGRAGGGLAPCRLQRPAHAGHASGLACWSVGAGMRKGFAKSLQSLKHSAR